MHSPQLTDTVVMISPDHFGFNPQTAATNVFQHQPSISETELREKAMSEFTGMVETLKNQDINVLVLPSRKDVVTPDATFPNNWFSTHDNTVLVLYPMLTPNRQAERQPVELKALLQENNITVRTTIDLSADEKNGNILEGTGSLVLDREHKVAFAMESPRTVKEEFDTWCEKMGYEAVFFHAYDSTNLPVYHTNVLMNIGKEVAVICADAITDQQERNMVLEKLKSLKKQVITITIEQMFSFCGNILNVVSTKGNSHIVMSETAYNAFTPDQKKILESSGEIVTVQIPLIESVSGGSARCMLAEIFHS